MAKFTPTLFEEGDHVTVIGGDHKGDTGRVVAWGHIGTRASDADTIHMIVLDKPKAVVARTETPQPDGSKVVREENVTLSQIDVPASQLALA